MISSGVTTQKIHWHNLVVEASRSCGDNYVKSALDPNKGLLFIKNVKVLEGYLTPWLPGDWSVERQKIIEHFEAVNGRSFVEEPLKARIELYYHLFLRLMRVINDAGLIL